MVTTRRKAQAASSSVAAVDNRSSPAPSTPPRRSGRSLRAGAARSVADLETNGQLHRADRRPTRKRPREAAAAAPDEAPAPQKRRLGPQKQRGRRQQTEDEDRPLREIDIFDIPESSEEGDDAGDDFLEQINSATRSQPEVIVAGEADAGERDGEEGAGSIVVDHDSDPPAPRRRGRPPKKNKNKPTRPRAIPRETSPASNQQLQTGQRAAPVSGRADGAEEDGPQHSRGADSESGDGSYATADEGLDEDQDLDLIVAPNEMGKQWEVTMNARSLRKLMRLMQKPGWTGDKSWEDDAILADMPPDTESGRILFEHLHTLADMLFAVPHAVRLSPRDQYNFTEQTEGLQAKHDELKALCKAVARSVRKIYDDMLKDIKPSNAGARGRKVAIAAREELVGDLRRILVPQMIFVLKNACMLGGATVDERREGRYACVEDGTFTPASLSIIAMITGWLGEIEAALTNEMHYGPVGKLYDVAPTTAGDETEIESKKAAREFQIRQRELLQVLQLEELVTDMEKTVAQAQRETQKLALLEERRRLGLEREKQIRRDKELAEEEEAARARRRWEAVCASTQALRRAPNPLYEHHRRTMGGGYRASADPGEAQALSSSAAGAGAAGSFAAEESEYLLNVLRRSAGRAVDWRRVAARLDRPVGEVLQQANMLRQAMRSLVKETKIGKPPKWARAS